MTDSTLSGGVLSLRTDPRNDRHHLYRNNRGNWWIHYTLHLPDHTASRVRRSLATRDLAEARRRRDEILARMSGEAVAS
ncbi:MAG: hypothetical protein R3F07_11910 [Opitutaceae bacterium]